MAEAEDVITDVARHATIFAQDLWRRHRPASTHAAPVQLPEVARRLELLVAAVFGQRFALRVAQPPAAPTWLASVFLRHRLPPCRAAVPATDGNSIWLPWDVGMANEPDAAAERFRIIVLAQAMRAVRSSVRVWPADDPMSSRELYLLLEARAADDALVRMLPGLAGPLRALRMDALRQRPPWAAFAAAHRPLEALARSVLAAPLDGPLDAAALPYGEAAKLFLPASPVEVLAQARSLSSVLAAQRGPKLTRPMSLWRDMWTGDLRARDDSRAASIEADTAPEDADGRLARSTRLARRPEVREDVEDEDDTQQGAWMVQPAAPHEQAEDPMGLQRPTDRDAATAAEDFADALSELPEARLVSAPGKPKEVLLSDDPPVANARHEPGASHADASGRVYYPEWDWRAAAYRSPGAGVLLLPAAPGPQQWVDETLEARRGMVHDIRRRFELLRARRMRMPRQFDGDDIDLEAWIESQADFRGGAPMGQRLYQREHRSRHDVAITLLVDVSGSTDGWIATNQRVIDVAREALLMVCIALEGMAARYNVLAFSGEGPNAVVVRSVKRFDEAYGAPVAQRIAGLEPEHYTRAGAAMRHASALLMREPAAHRLLLMLSDGKPNDVDEYEGRYGVEDMRQAVTEAKLQGIAPFCLTIDRQAATYLPAVFGPHHYAMLSRPESLPVVLLDWLRRLVAA